jgi:TolB-like protein/Flp pilus assembly protein TadD/tRNA A-37 threonylcarbamoyl transferase component Bud32
MLSHYRLVEKIGEGGMGEVWKALDTKLNRHVALKILPPELTADAERRLRFKREAQAAAALSHPNIAVIHEVGEHKGTPFIVMEFLAGKSLREHAGHRALSSREWLRFSIPVAEGLAHAHKHGIVHRDLKPDNVMITDEGQVKLLDFGLAKLLQPEALPAGTDKELHSRLETISRELTRAGKVFGTVAYMSPEQARGEAADHRSDLFSFGVMLYEMASGRLPFKGRSDVEALGATIATEPQPLSQVVEEMPAEAERVVRKALEKETERRYQDAADLAADLKNLQRDLDSGRASIPAAVTAGEVAGRRTAAPVGRRIKAWALAAALVVAAAAIVFGYLQLRPVEEPGESELAGSAGQQAGGEAATPERKMIVVLPFENLGPPEDEYFAAGMTEEITSRLAVVSGLGVISRKSAVRYAGTDKTTKQIGEELGVDYLVEGTVRWAREAGGASRVRITPQLIRVADDTHLWAEAYEWVIEDIFQVQSDIAGEVIEQLGVALLEPERRAVESKPTENPEAYNAYLRGMHHAWLPSYSEEDYRLGIEMFQRAVELDPGFALAHAQLAVAQSAMYHFGYDRTKERQAMARRAVDRAAELAPEAPEVHLALGYYHYWGHKDYERALEEFATAEKGLPNNAELLMASAWVYRRQGRWEEALASLEKALELDPMGALTAAGLGYTYQFLRRYPDAVRHFDRSTALAPEQALYYRGKAATYWLWTGTTEEARAALEEMPKAENPYAIWSWFWQEVYEGKHQEALGRLSSSSVDAVGDTEFYYPKALLSAHAYDLLNEPQLAHDAYDSARVILEREVPARPGDFRVHSALGIAFAGLGRKDDAIREGRRATELYPVSKDAYGGARQLMHLALIYTRVGEHDAALDQIEYLLSIPSDLSIPLLRLDPRWRPLWDHPRFKDLEKRFGTPPS